MTRRSAGSIRDLGDGRWRVAVAAGRNTDGTRRRLDKTIRGTRRDAEHELARMLLASGHEQAPRTMTLDEYLHGMWLPHCEQRVRANSLRGYRSKIDCYISPDLGALPLAGITPMAIDAWLSGPRIPAGSKVGAFRVLRAAMRQAVRWRLIDRDPLDAVTPPRRQRHEPTILTLEQARQVLAATRGTDLEVPIHLALGAGMRRSEVAGLTWGNVDLDAGTVRVVQGVHRTDDGLVVLPPKSANSRRTINLPAWCLDVLRPRRGAPGAFVASPDGTMPDPGVVSKAFRQLVDELEDVPPVPLRDLRHTHASLALAAGADITVVSRRLGHVNVVVTSDFYVRVGADLDRAAAESLDVLAPSRVKGVR